MQISESLPRVNNVCVGGWVGGWMGVGVGVWVGVGVGVCVCVCTHTKYGIIIDISIYSYILIYRCGNFRVPTM